MDTSAIEAAHARADLHDLRGRTQRQAREMRDLLRVAQSAIDSGRPGVAQERIAAVLRRLDAQIGAAS